MNRALAWFRGLFGHDHTSPASSWQTHYRLEIEPGSESMIVRKLVCPDCGSTEFLEGPHGGLAVNVKCARCGHFMCVTPLPDRKGFWISEGGRPSHG